MLNNTPQLKPAVWPAFNKKLIILIHNYGLTVFTYNLHLKWIWLFSLFTIGFLGPYYGICFNVYIIGKNRKHEWNIIYIIYAMLNFISNTNCK